MSVITISRETGSGGSFIAEKVAKTLGYSLVGKITIGRMYSKYGYDEYGMNVAYLPDFWTYADSPPEERRELVVDTLNHIILALAHRDKMVIVGRSSFAVLVGFADVLNVRIQAPLPLRVQRVMERRKIDSVDRAEALVRESDRVRAAFIQGFYGKRWDLSKSFDVVIDTGKVSEQLAISWLVQAAKKLQEQPLSGARTVKTIQVDPMLDYLISQELKALS